MQANTALWMTETYSPLARSVRPQVVRETFRGAVQRCQRCDIPLGSYLCPNPQCEEKHGEGTGNLCDWCQDEEAMERDDYAEWPAESLQWP